MARARFTPLQKVWHWITVALILVLATSGILFSAEIAPANAIRAHQATGQILILVLAARLITKLRVGRTPPHTGHAPAERIAAKSVHTLLYAGLIVSAISGYISASALRENVLIWPVSLDIAWSPFGDAMLTTHFAMKWVLLALISLHIAAALKHHLIDRDDTLSAIWIRPRKRRLPHAKA